MNCVLVPHPLLSRRCAVFLGSVLCPRHLSLPMCYAVSPLLPYQNSLHFGCSLPNSIFTLPLKEQICREMPTVFALHCCCYGVDMHRPFLKAINYCEAKPTLKKLGFCQTQSAKFRSRHVQQSELLLLPFALFSMFLF